MLEGIYFGSLVNLAKHLEMANCKTIVLTKTIIL